MSTFGVFKDVPATDTVQVAGVLQFASPVQLSQQNTSTTLQVGTIQYSTQSKVAAGGTTGTSTSQAGGTQLYADVTSITVAGADYSVVLPAAVVGKSVTVINTSATNAAYIYPYSGDAIGAAAANAKVTLPAASVAEFYATVGGGTGQWYCLTSTYLSA